MLTKFIIRLVFVALCFSFATAYATDVPCLPNHVIPPGYGTCREPDGAIRVGPPPAMARGAVVVAPPVYRPAPIVPYPTANTVIATPPAPKGSNKSTLFTVAGITALTGLIAALAGLIRAFR
jgi:hypothetical protein